MPRTSKHAQLACFALFAVFALTALLPAAAFAGTHRFELTPMAAYAWGGQLYSRDSELFRDDVEARDSEAFGVAFDIPLGSAFQIELLATRQATDFHLDEGLFEPDRRVADVDISYYHVGFLWQGGRGQVDPFFVVSLGVSDISPDLPGASSETRFSGSMGGGVKIFFSQNVGLRLEGRGFWTALDDSNDRHHGHDDYYDYHYDDGFYQGMAAVGLIFAW